MAFKIHNTSNPSLDLIIRVVETFVKKWNVQSHGRLNQYTVKAQNNYVVFLIYIRACKQDALRIPSLKICMIH